MEFTWLSRWQPQILALLRIVTGLLFLEHATMKFFAFPAPFPMPGPLPPLLVAAGVIDALASLKLQYPKVSAAKRQELGAARKALLATK